MSKTTQIILGVILLLLIVGGGWLYSKMEWTEKEMDLGYSKQAKQNHYLALQQFLDKQQIKATIKQGLSGIDKVSNYGTVVLSQAYGSLDKERASQLLNWVQNGGHLIMEAKNPFIHNLEDKNDIVFKQFNVSVIEDDDLNSEVEDQIDALKAELKDQEKKPKENCKGMGLLGEIEIKGLDTPLTIDFTNDQLLSAPLDDAFGWVAADTSDQLVRMVQFQHGDGLISFMGSLKLWRNAYISCQDNAFLLVQLIDPEGDLILFKNQEGKSLMNRLWQWTPYFVIGFALWLTAWLWRHGVRFGPIKHYQAYSMRQIIEHIEASSRLCWQHKQIEEQVNQLREDILSQYTDKHPGFRQLTTKQQARQLAKDSQLAYAMVDDCLFTPFNHKEIEFTRLLKGLQHIRNSL